MATTSRPVPAQRGWLASALPIAAAVVILFGLVVAALAAGQANLDAAKEVRLADRAAVTTQFDEAGDAAYGSSTAVERIAAIPFSPSDAAINEALLATIRTSAAGQVVVGSAVVDRAGTLVGAVPSDLSLPIGDLRADLDTALAAGGGTTVVFELDGEPVWGVMQALSDAEGDTWGLLFLVEPLRNGWLQNLYEAVGSFGPEEGGLTLVDRQGTGIASWDPARVGTQSAVSDMGGLTGGSRRYERVDDTGQQMVYLAHTPADSRISLIYEESAAAMYGDLIDAQRQRDLMVVLAGVAAVLLLGVFAGLRHRSVRRSRGRIDALLGSAHDIILLVDRAGTVTFASPAVSRMLGCEPDEVVGNPLSDLAMSQDAAAVSAAIEAANDHGHSGLLGVRLRCRTGEAQWFDLQMTADAQAEIPGILVTCHEIGTRRQLEDELSYRAGHDALTGLGNRMTFDLALEDAAAQNRPVAVMVIDLDHFKPLNDSLGHAAGDAALQAVANCLTDAVRATDVVCRLGGDEFAIVIVDTDATSAQALANRIIAKVGEAWPSFDDSVKLDCSIGVAIAQAPVLRPERLVRDADAAMYRAKQAGGGHAHLVTTAVEASEPPTEPIARPSSDSTVAFVTTGSPVDQVVQQAAPRQRRVLSARRQGAAAWLLTVGLAAVVVVAGLNYGRQATAKLEENRIDDRRALIEGISELSADLLDTTNLLPTVNDTPWDFDNAGLTEFIVAEYAKAPQLGDDSMAAVLDRSGAVVAVHPPGTPVALDLTSELWSGVLDGIPFGSPVIHDGEQLRTYFVVPIIKEGRVDHIMVMGANPTTTSWSNSLHKMGSLTAAPGGMSIVDINGVSSTSWNLDTLGEQIVDPSLLAGLELGDSRTAFFDFDGEPTVAIAVAVPRTNSPAFGVWTQDEATLFADLRQGQGTRDAAIIAIVVAALMALTFINRREEIALRSSERRLDALLQQAHDIVIVLGNDRKVRFTSAAVTRHLGIEREHLVGTTIDEVFGAEATEKIATAIAGLGNGRATTVSGIEATASDGTIKWFDIEIADLRRHAGIGGYLLTCHEVSDRIELEALLTDKATRDPLTGLVNRAQFNTHLDTLSARRTTRVGTDAVVFIDLDHFKPINDAFGHQAGDELLRVIAGRLNDTVRANDIVCRLGGDEFALLLTDCDLELAKATVERLLDAIREPIALSEGVVQVDASVGVALSRSEVTNAEQLVREADQAMYEAKRAGRGRYVVEA